MTDRNDELQLEALEGRVAALTQSVRRLRDLEEIRQLRCHYHAMLNDSRTDEHFDRCTEDVICQWGEEIPATQGRAANQAMSRKVNASGIAPSFRQTIHNHLIKLDGDEASATSQMEASPVQFGRSVTVGATWTDRYRRENGSWWISEQRLKFYYQVFLDEGWAKDDRVINPFVSLKISSNVPGVAPKQEKNNGH